jgi:hypothetical protein
MAADADSVLIMLLAEDKTAQIEFSRILRFTVTIYKAWHHAKSIRSKVTQSGTSTDPPTSAPAVIKLRKRTIT